MFVCLKVVRKKGFVWPCVSFFFLFSSFFLIHYFILLYSFHNSYFFPLIFFSCLCFCFITLHIFHFPFHSLSLLLQFSISIHYAFLSLFHPFFYIFFNSLFRSCVFFPNLFSFSLLILFPAQFPSFPSFLLFQFFLFFFSIISRSLSFYSQLFRLTISKAAKRRQP